MKKKMLTGLLALAMVGTMAMSAGAEEAQDFSGVTLSLLLSNENTMDGIDAVVAAAEEKFGFDIVYDTIGNSGDEFANLIKARLVAGEMNDMVVYNAGALLKQLNPAEYLLDISQNADILDKLDPSFVEAVTVDDAVYGVPYASSQAGCVLYNKEIYAELGLEVPHTWDDFLANCEVIKEAGEVDPIIVAWGDKWPGIVVQYGDFYNIHELDPDFVPKLEAREISWSTSEIGINSYQKVIDIVPYSNEDSMSTSYADAVDRFAEGEAAHWIILTSALSNINSLYGDEVTDKIGAFGVPGDDPENHGITVWMPLSIYASKDSENLEAVQAFMEYYISDEALTLYSEQVTPDGPYCVKGYEIADTAPPAVREDLQAYFDEGKTYPALEYTTALQAADTDNIMQQMALGQMTAEEGTAAIDQGIEAVALQLGLDW